MHTLRGRYLIVATGVCLLLLGAAIIASRYTNLASKQNTHALELRDQVTETIGNIRNAIWKADIALNAALISPSTAYESDIVDNLDFARQRVNVLMDNRAIKTAGLEQSVQTLQAQLSLLTGKIQRLLEQRKDPNWVYPLLPFINRKLLEPNNTFETAAALALQEIAEDDGRPYASERYAQFDQVRDLWRRKILNFRAVIIRFAGLNDVDVTPQELNIGQLNEEIQRKLALLQNWKDLGKLGLESEEALAQMQSASERWQQNWSTAKDLRSSSIWRADLHDMETVVRPLQQRVFNALTAVDKKVTAWSAQNITTVQRAARRISAVLWGLAGVALGFVVLVYLMIDRSVLQPVAQIANSLVSEDAESTYRLQAGGSREIDQLVIAFNTMRKQIRQRQLALEHQAMHDALTGLPNRMLMQDRLQQAIRIMSRNDQSMALLLLDLDRFKEVNDALGHQVGDQLLQRVGRRLEELLRTSDTVARLGGDEFAIVAPNTASEQALRFADKIASVINEVFPVGNRNLYVGVSIGVAVYPQHGQDAATLIRHADIAMYAAKRNNLDVQLYDLSHDEDSMDRLALVDDLHSELQNSRRLQVYYQPLIDLFSREVVGVEALTRWEHPQMGNIVPEQIINMAEQTGLIDAMTRWVIDTALTESRDFGTAGEQLSIAVNLSAWNLQDPELPGNVARALRKHGVPAEKLTLEITESAMMNDPIRARHVLAELNAMGVNLAIDDFGTGFSSLGYLKMLPVNNLKIDRSFVINMQEDKNDAIIVHSTIELAHNLGLKVTAEGVENHESLLRLRQQKCDTAQGFYISQPLTANTFKQWLSDYRLRLAR